MERDLLILLVAAVELWRDLSVRVEGDDDVRWDDLRCGETELLRLRLLVPVDLLLLVLLCC